MLNDLFSNPLPIGTSAPDFTLADQDGNTVTLSALRGSKVVLVFYPRDETPVCEAQLCEFRDNWSSAKAAGVHVFGINPGGAQSHSKFRNRLQLPFPLLVDEGRRVAKLYRASGLLTKRTVYLIGEDGVIRFARRGKPHPSEVLATASA